MKTIDHLHIRFVLFLAVLLVAFNVQSEESDVRDALKAMSKDDFCIAYGKLLRDGQAGDLYDIPEAINPALKKEAARRKISLNAKLIKSKQIRIGTSQCELYASWGVPYDETRMVGSWGVHIQHIYGEQGPYVYTENGRVTSWQD